MESWNSRRSSVLSKNGMCASSQPLASAAGVRILQNGGTAADAAVAMAAALNVTEPCSTGIGGDAFALYYEAATKKVFCLQGNGASSANLNLDLLKQRGFGIGEGLKPLDSHSGLCITVPGAAALWEDLVSHHGRLNLNQVLTPAIELAEEGFPIGTITAKQWSKGYLQGDEAFRVFKPNGRFPQQGEIVKNPDLAETFRTIAESGTREGFYSGRIGEAIVKAAADIGGVLSLDDLEYHRTTFQDPISLVYKGVRIYQTPPPTHGLAVLEALGLAEETERRLTEAAAAASPPSIKGAANNARGASFKPAAGGTTFDFSSPDLVARGGVDQAHLGIECMRLAFADALQHITDPVYQEALARNNPDIANDQPTAEDFLHPAFLSQRALGVSMQRAGVVKASECATFFHNPDTVYFCVVDREGNACSMINSNYMGFGTGMVPQGCGFTLHNRGHNFSLVSGHPNAVAPRKKPYHTIIPGLATNESDGSLYAVFGNMVRCSLSVFEMDFKYSVGWFYAANGTLSVGAQPDRFQDGPTVSIECTPLVHQRRGEVPVCGGCGAERGVSGGRIWW